MIVLIATVGCRPAAPPAPDVLLITVDTTRADRIGCYGDDSAHTPNLDRLAARGRRFDRAMSTVPLTIPSHGAILTGRYPPRLGLRANGDGVLEPAVTTLAERLRGHGYRTAASVGAFVTSRTWGFDQGFERFYDGVESPGAPWKAERGGAAVVADLLGWEARSRDEAAPRFAWAHLYDPHFPYLAGDAWLQHTSGRAYEAEIASMDAQIGRLVDAFDRRPTWVVVVGDHGESRGEHDESLHGWFVYDATQRVPWIVSGPGVPPGEVIATPTSIVDVAPSLLAWLGLPALPEADGVPQPAAERPLYMESWQLAERFGLAPHVAVVQGRWKLIAQPRPELYDVVADPGEGTDLSASRPDDVARLEAALHDFGFEAPDRAELRKDPDVVRRLALLGYVAGGALPVGDRPDAKDHRDLLVAAQSIDQLSMLGRWADADARLAALIEAHPGLTELLQRRAWVSNRLGRPDEATALIRRALELRPDDPELTVDLATQLAGQGRYDDAAELYLRAAGQLPWSSDVRAMALRALLDARSPGVAATQGTAWLERWPTDAGVAGLTGIAWLQVKQVGRALPLLEQGSLAARPERGVLYNLSAAAAGKGDRGAARDLLRRELEHHPASLEAVSAMVNLLLAEGEPETARAVVGGALLLRPDDPALLALRDRAD